MISLVDAAGQFVGAWGMVSDITARKQAEELVARERDQFQQVLDVLPAANKLVELRAAASPEFASRFGVSAEGAAAPSTRRTCR